MTESITLINEALGASVTMDRDNADYLLDDNDGIDWGSISEDSTLNENVDGVGNEILHSKVTTPRQISIVGWVINPDMEGKKKLLSRVLAPLNTIRIETRGVYIEGQIATAVRFTGDYKTNNEVMCKFYVVINCPIPFFVKRQLVEFENNAELLNLGDVYSGLDLSLTLQESASDILIRMSHAGVTNSMYLSGNFAAGDVVHVCTIAGKKGVYVNSIKNFSILNLNSSWIAVPKSADEDDKSEITVSVPAAATLIYNEYFGAMGDM